MKNRRANFPKWKIQVASDWYERDEVTNGVDLVGNGLLRCDGRSMIARRATQTFLNGRSEWHLIGMSEMELRLGQRPRTCGHSLFFPALPSEYETLSVNNWKYAKESNSLEQTCKK